MKLRTLIKHKTRNFFLKQSGKATKPGQLRDFFAMIKPVNTNHKLIRIGGESDGSYLVPDDLDGINVLFSPGVSIEADFEFQLADRGMKCYLADYSVAAPPLNHANFSFEKKYLGPIEDDIYMTLESWVKKNEPSDNELMLQMDIEGSEYGVLFDTSNETLSRFRIVVIEFHRLDALIDKFGFELIMLTFQKLLKHFEIVHIHPNNSSEPVRYGDFDIPPDMEFTFLRKDRITSKNPAREFPHVLDRKNAASKPDVTLPACWYR